MDIQLNISEPEGKVITFFCYFFPLKNGHLKKMCLLNFNMSVGKFLSTSVKNDLLILIHKPHIMCFCPMVFHWSLNDSKSPQISRTLLRILADFKWCSLDGLHSFSPVPSVSFPGFWEPFQGHQKQLKSPSPCSTIFFFSSLARSSYLLSFLLVFFFSHSMVRWNGVIQSLTSSFLLVN